MNIISIITSFETNEQIRLKKLQDYYIGKNEILNSEKAEGKPNNKIAHNYAKNIVNNTTGYLLGNPIVYNVKNNNEKENNGFKDKISEITNYNDDDAHNLAIATDLSKFGVAYELLWIDEAKKIRYSKLNPLNTIVRYTDDIDKKIKWVLYYYDVIIDEELETTQRHVVYYDKERIVNYVIGSESGEAIQESEQDNIFVDVPINVFFNNEDMQGDYENVLSQIDAYDKMQSESLNDFEQFADAYLFVSQMDVSDEAVKEMKNNRVIVGDGQACWLVKQTNDTYIENIKNRLDADIYKQSNTVNMSDKEFGNNLSGIAIKYKLMNMENRISVTQRYFEKGLLRRWELICGYLNKLGGNFIFTDVSFTFTRNIPVNLNDYATIAQQFKGVISNKTLMSILPFIDDVDKELMAIKNEEGTYTPFEE